MELIKPFSQLGKNDAAIAGGKGASLGEMTRAGIPVPPGFVILSDAFERFITETGLIDKIEEVLGTVDPEAMSTVDLASQKIQDLILTAQMPADIAGAIEENFAELDAEHVAVRSSATVEDSASAAWAGQLDSYLNTTHEELLRNVQRCWASLFTPRAIFYRFEKKLHLTKISVAVVVQKMVHSEVSGIAFSVHPVTEDRNQLIIEAGYGLGEAIVSGQVTPDSYVVEKTPRRISEINVSTQTRGLYRASGGGNEWKVIAEPQASAQTLETQQIHELADIVLTIEKHYGFPCDIEWAYESGKFYIVQSRPITTLSASTHQAMPTVLSKIYTREKPLLYFCTWDRSDRKGTEEFIGKKIQNNLFVVRPRGRNGEVWYSWVELEPLINEAVAKINANRELQDAMLANANTAWDKLEPYLVDGKKIDDIAELQSFFGDVVDFWCTMNTVYFQGLERDNLDRGFRERINALRERTQEYTDVMATTLVGALERLLPQYKHLSYVVTPEEAVRLAGGDSSLVAELENRAAQGCFMLNGKVYMLEALDKTLLEHDLMLERIDTVGNGEVKGTSAYGGRVSGRVCVVLSKADLPRVGEGDILVSEVTDPDYVPAMKRAGALVSDEGGIMSHTAIVARELKKPAIIGTKIGTQVLKDGDMVEVDAERGVVRILEKAAREAQDNYIFMWSTRPEMTVSTASPMSVAHRRDVIPADVSILHYYDGDMSTCYASERDMAHLRDTASPRYLDPDFYKKYWAHYEAEKAGWWQWVREVEPKDFGTASNEELLPVYTKFVENVYNSIANFWTSRPEFTFAAEERLKAILHAQVGDRDVEVEAELIAPTEVDDIQHEMLARAKLGKNPTKDELMRHASNFPWFLFGQYDDKAALAFMTGMLKESKDYAELEREIMGSKKRAAQKQDELYASFPGPVRKEARYLAEFIKSQAHQRVDIKAYWAGCFWLCRKMLLRVAANAGISIADMLGFIAPEEIKLFLGGGFSKTEVQDMLARRKRAWIIVRFKDSELKIYDGDEATEIFRKYVRLADTNVDTIHGQTASRGLYKGKVRKVLAGVLDDLEQSMRDFKKGEVLVTSMTQPNMMVLANRAGAIITDEGGIASHAAIISRELHIPCVVGCSHAMQVLNDGDEVEVDANNAVVRITKRASQ